MKTVLKADTKIQILDIAEHHFALYGYAGTSLRGIIKEAKVNVAAVAYHFGNKEDLFTAVMARFAIPIVTQQLEQLRVEMEKESMEWRELLLAFYQPPIKFIKDLGARGETLSLFLGRAQTEPEPVYSMVDKHYATCRNEFINGFRRLLPNLSEAEYQWRFEFMLSLIVCFLTRQKFIRKRYADNEDWQADEVIERLINYCEPAMKSRTHQTS